MPVSPTERSKRRWSEPRVRKFDAVWLQGPVPAGYWDSRANRRRYLCWLGQKRGFRWYEDWYRITTDDLKHNRGGGLLAHYWNSSVVYGVQDAFPEYDWKEWLFKSCPREFWDRRGNHRRYMKWLGKQLGIRRCPGWYRVTNRDFTRHKGGAFLLHYNSTISAAVMANFPHYDWKEWLFRKIPKGLWNSRENRRRYLDWLGNKLGLTDLDGWYSVTREQIEANHGSNLLKMFSGSPYLLVKDAYPEHDWKEWMFARVPLGFWRKKENRRRYLQWLGRRLGYRRARDWYRVRKEDFTQHYGGGLVASVHSYLNLLQEEFPDLDWSPDTVRLRQQRRGRARNSHPARTIPGLLAADG